MNRDSKAFGKQNLIDGSDETCWNSDSGENQWIMIRLDCNIVISKLKLMFQGGFAGKKLVLFSANNDELGTFFPEDTNAIQTFNLSQEVAKPTNILKLVFDGSFDFFGRITIYHLNIFGKKV